MFDIPTMHPQTDILATPSACRQTKRPQPPPRASRRRQEVMTMAQGRPVEETVRARAIELIKQGIPRNAIARELFIAPSSVSGIARDEGLSFDRATQTASATAARMADLKTRRLELIDELMSKAMDHIVAIDQPVEVFNFGGADNSFNSRVLDRVPVADREKLQRAASIALKDARELIRDDDDEGVAEAESMLMNLILELGLHEDE